MRTRCGHEGHLTMAEELDERFVKAMPAPETGNRITYDLAVKGFGIRVTSAGAKAFILNYRAGGRERRITIGSDPDWKVTAARERAKDLKREVDNGGDPMGERHEQRAAPTVSDLAQLYRTTHLPRKRATSQVGDEYPDQPCHPPAGEDPGRGRAPDRHRGNAPLRLLQWRRLHDRSVHPAGWRPACGPGSQLRVSAGHGRIAPPLSRRH